MSHKISRRSFLRAAGLINLDHPDASAAETNDAFREGNTAFYVGTLGRFTQNEDGSEAFAVMDTTQQNVLASGSPAYCKVAEELSTAQTAQLVGQMYLAKTDADALDASLLLSTN